MEDAAKNELGHRSLHDNNSKESIVESPMSNKEIGMSDTKEDVISIALPTPSIPSPVSDHDPFPTIPPPLPASIASLAVPIARGQRRGLFSSLTLIPEVTTPTSYPRRTKWIITSLIAVAAAAAPMGSAIVLPVLTVISSDFHTTATITNLNVAIYMLAMSVFPLWWSSFSETVGRRTIYLVSFALFVLWGLLSAVSTNITMLVVMRVLSGGAAASVQAVGAGTIADIWEPKERGRAMGFFYLGPLCGPLFAPIIGGAMGQGLGWRSTQWFLVVYGGFTLVGLLFGLPETLKKRRDVAKEAEQEAIQRTASENRNGTVEAADPEKMLGEEVEAGSQRPIPLTRVSSIPCRRIDSLLCLYHIRVSLLPKHIHTIHILHYPLQFQHPDHRTLVHT